MKYFLVLRRAAAYRVVPFIFKVFGDTENKLFIKKQIE